MAKFTKEHRPPPRGPGKLNQTVKETVLAVFNQIQENPKVNLESFAVKYPRDFYAIAAKLIPTEVSAKIDNKINLHIVRTKSGIARITPGTGESIEPGEPV